MAVGYAGYGTPEQVQRRREIADALMASVFRGSQAPRTVGEALSQGGSQFGAALASRGVLKQAEKTEREGRKAARSQNREAIARALGGVSGGRSPSPVSGTGQSRTGAPARPTSAARGLPPGLMDATFKVESNNDPNAVSPKGAMGVGQVMPDTARDPGYGVPNIFDTARQMGKEVPDESDATLNALLRDPEVNKAFSTNYMTAMHREQGGDINTTLAAYNAGPGAVSQHGGVPPYAETQRYVQDVRGRMAEGPASTMTDAGPQQPAQPQPDIEYIEGLASVLENPWSSDGDKAMAQMLLQQHMEQMQGPEPMSQYERAQLGLKEREFGLDRQRLELEREKARSTGDLTEYDRYVEQQKARGQEPLGFLEYQQALKGGGTSMRFNPDTGEFEFSQGGPGGVDRTSAGTPGRTQVDKKFAETYTEWTTGGKYDAEKNLAQLNAAAEKLESGENITGAFLGLLPDSVLAAVNPAAINTKQLIEEVVQRNLRTILGAQFTEKEGERLIARAFNPQLDEATNRRRLQRLMQQMQNAYDAKESAARYFEQHGTLSGWEGRLYDSVDDFDLSESGGGKTGDINTPPDGWEDEWPHLNPDERKRVLEAVGG